MFLIGDTVSDKFTQGRVVGTSRLDKTILVEWEDGIWRGWQSEELVQKVEEELTNPS
jgi:hypothetical protein